MSLRDIVRAVGGDLYDGGMRANIPAPGHSREDRSVSLMWSGGRVLVHSFGRTHWRDVLDHLKSLGVGGAETSGPAPWPLRPTAEGRIALARRLWAATRPLIGTLGERHLRQRRIARSAPGAIRFGPAAPISVYAESSACRPALVAAILEPRGALQAVELTYLDPTGRRATTLRLSRKTVGRVPPGSAVRLDPPAATLLVAEGVASALSASERFGLPAWALLAAQNLARWSPPAEARHVVIAADRGAAGEGAAATLLARLRRGGVTGRIALPPEPFGDWNEAAGPKRDGEGR